MRIVSGKILLVLAVCFLSSLPARNSAKDVKAKKGAAQTPLAATSVLNSETPLDHSTDNSTLEEHTKVPSVTTVTGNGPSNSPLPLHSIAAESPQKNEDKIANQDEIQTQTVDSEIVAQLDSSFEEDSAPSAVEDVVEPSSNLLNVSISEQPIETSKLETKSHKKSKLIKPTVEQLNVPIVPVQLPDLQNISESLNDDATNHTVDLLVQQQQQQATVAAAPKLPPDKEAPKEKQPSAATVSEEPKPANQSEEIPSFNEWAQKQLAEAEKKKVQNTSELPKAAPKAQGNIKIRSKNYASPDCGAKIVGANQEAQHASSVLSSSQDEYALSPCNSAKIWFVVELCEAIQPKQIELANYELFSSSPQEFSVFFSDRYPTRDWHLVGQFTAQDERTVQSFNLEPFPSFGKFIKVEMHSHYGKEHFCPVSLFRAYGTSEFEVLETEEEGHSARHAEEDDIDDDVAGSIQPEKVQPKNLFGSATEAVISIVKKAAQAANVFAKTGDSSNSTSSVTDMLLTNNTMCSMSPNIPFEELCPNCTPGVLNLLTCNYRALRAMLSSNYVLKALQREQLCFRTSFNESFLGVMLGPDYISALCRILLSLHPAPINMSLAEDANSDFVLVVKPSGQPSGVSTCSKVSGSSADISSGEKESSLDSSVPIQPTQTLKQKKDSEEVQIESVVAPTASVHLDIVPVEQAPQENLIEEVAAPEDETDQNVTEEWPASENGEVVDLLPEDEGSDVVELTSQSSQQTHQTSSSTTTTNAAPATPSSATPNPVNVHMQGGQQKESAFVRLANRIKALERNMSLSAQYLEELSKRYKKQVDEMQKAYDRTLAAVSESSRQAAQREQIQAEKFNSLEQRFLILAETAAILLAEKDSWQYKFQAICHNVILVSAAVYLILHLIKKIGVRTVKESTPDLDRRLSVFKRHLSADDIPNDEPIRKRRTSELETEVCPSPKLKVPEKKLVLPLALKHDPLADKENRLDPYKKKRKRLRRELRGMSVQDLCSGLSPGTLAIMRAPTLKVAPKPSISPIHRLTPIKGRRHSTDNSIIDNEFWKKEFKMSLSHSDKIAVFTNGEEGKEGSTLTVELIKADEDENTPPAAQTVQQPKKSSSGLKKMVKKLF